MSDYEFVVDQFNEMGVGTDMKAVVSFALPGEMRKLDEAEDVDGV